MNEFAALDRRVVVRRQSNAGYTAARNRACRMARAPLIACLDADDVALAERLQCQREFLAAHPDVAAVGGGVRLITDTGRTFATKTPPATHAELRKLASVTQVVVGYRLHSSMMSMHRIEEEGLFALAARVSARARAAGKADPLAAVQRVERQTLLQLGVDDHEITEAIVQLTTWLARTFGRAGYEHEDALFSRALALARDASGSRALVKAVVAQRVDRLREQGRPFRARIEALRARWIVGDK